MSPDVIILISVFLLLLLASVPVAVGIGLATMLAMLATADFAPAASTMAQRIATGLDSFTLLAIPFFILAGNIMGRGGIARRLIEFAKALVGWIPGGLALVNVISNMMFGAISGSAIASAAAIGSFMHPKMVEEGYPANYSAAVNVTSATTGLVIPPSNVLIVYSLASGGVSIAALFIAGYLPGIVIGLLLMTVAGIMAKRGGFGAAARTSIGDIFRRFGDAILGLSLILIVIGGIVAGIFTATEAAAIAVIYALLLSMVVYREVAFKDLSSILLETVVTTAVVMLLIGTSMGLAWLLAYQEIPQTVGLMLIELSANPILVLLIINLVLLVVGTFMDMTPAILIFTPIFLPTAVAIGIDPLHFGIIMVVNLCIGLVTPPVGTVLFAGCGIAKVSMTDIVRPLLPMYVAMIIGLLLITFFPQITMWVPGLLGLL
ncbi:MAG: TRAP transporter large permease subunit [Bacteroidota bacterium]